jgi:hypothetical protein
MNNMNMRRLRQARAGGKKRGWQERKEALLRYQLNPHFCHHCGKMLEVGDRRVADVINKKFCNLSCAGKHNMNLTDSSVVGNSKEA